MVIDFRAAKRQIKSRKVADEILAHDLCERAVLFAALQPILTDDDKKRIAEQLPADIARGATGDE